VEHLSRSSRVSAVRASTRREILRRVSRARDFIESHLPDHFTLCDIGRAAAMSVFHFHRSFVEVFGETPHEYTTRRRLALATDLLASTDLTIGDVSFAAGFGSPTSFSAAFRRHEAHSPIPYAQALPIATVSNLLGKFFVSVLHWPGAISYSLPTVAYFILSVVFFKPTFQKLIVYWLVGFAMYLAIHVVITLLFGWSFMFPFWVPKLPG